MVWILLLVHITLHGMIGGLLTHFRKAVCGIMFFICKNVFECQKRKLFFFLSLSQCIFHSHADHEHNVQFKLRERDFFVA